MREMVGGCCVCSDDRGWSENPLVYCDGQSCTVAVHQACYGIVTVPTGPWYCRKCESQERSVKVKCELCPSKYGALKRTDNSGWAHVVCALYIPEVRFGNVTTMEPIQLQLIPTERFNKVCYICEEKGKASSATVGACMQCNKAGCKQQFHVTCAQSLGLLCEEAGNYLDNVKYCGYCQHHYSKLKKGGNVKTIPPYKPVSSENHLSDSNSEKEVEAASGSSKTTSSSGQQISNTSSSSTSSNKRKASSSSKTSSSSSSKTSSSTKSSSSSSSSHQKTVHSSSSSSTTTPSVINNSSNTGATSGSNNTTGSKSGGSGSTDSKSKLSSSSSNIRSAKNLQEDSASSTNLTNSVVETVDKLETNQSTDTIPSTTTSSGGTNNNNNNNINTSSGGNSTTTNKDIVKNSKKRKTHSRTPTPVGLSAVEGGGVSVVQSVSDTIGTTAGNDKKSSGDTLDKPKKIKVETTQSILTNQPVVALTSISTIKSLSLSSTTPTLTDSGDSSTIPIHSNSSNSTIIQSSSSHPPVNSLVVSVPLTSTSLSPHSQILNNQTSVVQPTPGLHLESVIQERSSASANGNQSKMIVYDKQDTVTEVDMELEISPQDIKRSSQEKSEKTTRGSKKRISGANGVINQLNQSSNHSQSSQPPTTVTTLPKRSSRSSSAAAAASSTTTTPSPSPQIQGAFSSISQSQIKDSPPSSPSSESQQSTASGRAGSSCSKTKTRKSAPASISTPALSPKETKDIKLFQNGCTAPHMLGNQLNPNSNMAQKMSDHLNSELEAHSIFNPNEPQPNMVGPQLHHRVIASARASSAGGSSTASGGSTSGGSGISSMLGGSGGNIPQTLDQLLERQWEQGSQFLMEQAQHFDIASLLSCLHQLRAENLRLEEHVSSLLQRRDHLLAVNARLAIPLTGQPATPQSSHPHTVNNIHPAVGASHGDIPRSSRHSYPAHPQGSQHPSGQIIENGLQSNEPQYSHRSPAPPQSQPSPSISRHSPAGPGYPSSNIYRQSTSDVGGRSASAGSSSGSRATPQGYPLYQGPGGPSSSQPQIIRRDSDIHYQSSSKPS